jgi:hypothetical protein
MAPMRGHGKRVRKPLPCHANLRLVLSGAGPCVLQPIRSGLCGFQELIPIVGRIAILQHGAENGVGVGFCAVLAQRAFVVHPGKYDRLDFRAVSEEQPEAPVSELGPEPVLVFRSKRLALTVDVASWVLGNRLEDKGMERSQKLGIGARAVGFWFFRRSASTARISFSNCSSSVGWAKTCQPLTINGRLASERDFAFDVFARVKFHPFDQTGDPLRKSRRKGRDRLGAALDVAREKRQERSHCGIVFIVLGPMYGYAMLVDTEPDPVPGSDAQCVTNRLRNRGLPFFGDGGFSL